MNVTLFVVYVAFVTVLVAVFTQFAIRGRPTSLALRRTLWIIAAVGAVALVVSGVLLLI